MHNKILKLESQLIAVVMEINNDTRDIQSLSNVQQRTAIETSLVLARISHKLSTFVELNTARLYTQAPALFTEIAAARAVRELGGNLRTIRTDADHSHN